MRLCETMSSASSTSNYVPSMKMEKLASKIEILANGCSDRRSLGRSTEGQVANSSRANRGLLSVESECQAHSI